MNDAAAGAVTKARRHFWVIGVLALLWYTLGAFTIQLAEIGQLPGIRADEVAYYAARPLWLKISTGFATYGSLLGAILLLARRRWAMPIFTLALWVILLNNAVELWNGTSRVYANTGAAVVTCIIVAIAVFMVWYSRRMQKRGSKIV